jgi:SMI1-KNR4 cell-wall
MKNIEQALNLLRAKAEVLSSVNNPNLALTKQREVQLGLNFPDDLLYFFMNSADLFFGTKEQVFISADTELRGELGNIYKNARRAGMPKDWIPICMDNGDFFCYSLDGNIRYLAHDGQSSEVWSSLAEWIELVWLQE